jgi:hypothetical protein
LQGYYQYQWEADNLQGVGSYFSTSDSTGPGGQRIIAATVPGLGNLYLFNTKALTPPSQNGQFGASIQAQYGSYAVGLFALRYDSKTPTAYASITGFTSTPYGLSLGNYRLVYPRDIQLYGASLSTAVGATNVAGEISGRRNMPLVGTAMLSTAANPGNANSNPLYPVGDTLTGLASAIYVSPAIKFDPGGVTVEGEVQYLQVLSVTANPSTLAPGRTPASATIDISATPAYYEILPSVELQFPVSVTYNIAGNSQIDPSVNHGTGSVTLGVQATYRQTWIASFNYVDFLGKPSAVAFAPNASASADRSYVTFNIQHTF